MNLSQPQQKTLSEIRNALTIKELHDKCHIPDGGLTWCDIYREGDVICGNWNTLTLKALARKGFIDILKIGNFWQDKVIIL